MLLILIPVSGHSCKKAIMLSNLPTEFQDDRPDMLITVPVHLVCD